jgi:uridine kinase
MFSSRDVEKVVSLVEQASVAGRTTPVAVDGLMGAGKSTLTAQVAEAIGDIVVVPGDDFYRPIAASQRLRLGPEDSYEGYFEWRRLRDSVLVPLSRESRARYRRHDWASDAPAEWREVGQGGIVIVDGVFSTRPGLAPYYGVTVFVETPRDLRLTRILDRGYEDLSWVEHWMAAEDWYMASVRPAEHVGLVLDGSSS